jgi:hypothetical protein
MAQVALSIGVFSVRFQPFSFRIKIKFNKPKQIKWNEYEWQLTDVELCQKRRGSVIGDRFVSQRIITVSLWRCRRPTGDEQPLLYLYWHDAIIAAQEYGSAGSSEIRFHKRPRQSTCIHSRVRALRSPSVPFFFSSLITIARSLSMAGYVYYPRFCIFRFNLLLHHRGRKRFLHESSLDAQLSLPNVPQTDRF